MRLTSRLLLVSLILLANLLHPSDAIGWLSVASVASVPSAHRKPPCKQLSRTRRQRRFCKRYRGHMPSFFQGAIRAISECEFQFQKRRWNCSIADGYSLFNTPLLDRGIRETSFLHSIASAGAAYDLTRNCRIGLIPGCGCDSTAAASRELAGETFQSHGCSDNIRYAIMLSRKFVDLYERRKNLGTEKYLVNQHNNEAGRETIRTTMQAMCRCHGFSGNCNIRTCWRRMADFRTIGKVLKDRFDGATKVMLLSDNDRTRLVPEDTRFKEPTAGDLVYLENSPTFCLPDNSTGTLGTRGRKCEIESRAIDGCELMCCGRGYETFHSVKTERCHCIVTSNLEVKCKQCKYRTTDHYCN